MESIDNYKSHSIFLKILILFMTVILIVYAFNSLVNIWSRNSVKNDIMDYLKLKNDFYMDILEKELVTAMRLESRLVNDSNLQRLSINESNIYDFEQMKAMKDLQKACLNIKEVNRFIQDIFVYIPMIRKKISTTSFNNMEEEEYENIISLSKTFPFAESGDRLFINMSTGFSSDVSEGLNYPAYVISMEISKTVLGDMLNTIAAAESGGVMLIGESDWMVATEQKNQFLEYVRENMGTIAPLQEDVKSISINNERVIVGYKHSSALKTTMLIVIPENEILRPLNRYSIWFWAATALTILVTVFFSLYIRRLIVSPLVKLVEAFGSIKEGRLDVSVDYRSYDEFRFLYRTFNIMVERLKNLIEQVYEQKIRAQNAELKQLQYQINPHFLYNSLFLMQRMAKMDDTEGVSKLAQHMGNFYQFITKNTSFDVPLILEVNHARDYAEIQNFRFFKRITFQIDDIPDNCANIMIPRLTIQPIIENCYNHGLVRSINNGIIKLWTELDGNILYINVEDNGELEDEKLEELKRLLASGGSNIESTGLLNVHRRIQIKYGNGSGILLSKGEMSGLHVRIKIVLKGGEERV